MSKLCILYDTLKHQNKETIYLFKSGIFFIALKEDAFFLSNTFGFKLTNLNKTTEKCGFPTSSIKKYTELFNNHNIKFKIIDSGVKMREHLLQRQWEGLSGVKNKTFRERTKTPCAEIITILDGVKFYLKRGHIYHICSLVF